MKNLTKKQKKNAARLIVGCVAMFSEFGLDEASISEDDIQNIHDEIQLLAYKLIGKDDAFANTSEIIEYVKKNF